MDYGLKGKNVLITGSTKGMGKAAVELFAQEGANVIISGRSLSEAQTVAQEITDRYGVTALPLVANLAVAGEAEALFSKAVTGLGSLDILVNNAASWPTAYVKDMEKEAFEETVYLNLEVPYILSRLCVNHLIERNSPGKIINVVSQAAFHGSTTGHAHYAASKAGMVAFMISQAREVAKHGITINAVAPGIVRTPMLEAKLSSNLSYYQDRIPLGRVAEPEEVAQVMVWLASRCADYLTGATIDATGGMLMR